MINCEFENGNKASLRHTTVGVIIVKGERALLVRRAEHLSEGGKWALAGGFVDRDETILEAAKREVLEETGYEIHDLQLLRVNDNPNRPHEDRQNIDFVFIGQAGKEVNTPDDETAAIKWFALNEIDTDSLAFDHGDNIEIYKHVLKNGEKLPPAQN